MTTPPTMDHQEMLKVRLTGLKTEHRDLDEAIVRMEEGIPDMLMLRRMKKRKLLLKDMITRLEDEITPDIIA